MAQLRTAGVLNATSSSGLPAMVATAGAMPEDPRTPGTVGSSTDAGYLNFLPMTVLVAAAPSALLANNIATSQTGASGVALTLTAGTGVSTGSVSGTTALFLDGIPSSTNQTTDFTLTLTRAVRITSSGNDSGITFLVTGWDLYNNVQTNRITGGNATAVSTIKCFKAIASVIPSGATASGVQVGTADSFGFPMRVDNFDEALIFWNGALITLPTGFTGAVTTAATATTGEPKGRYSVQSASDGTKRLVIYQMPKSLTTVATLFGVTPA